MTLQEAATLLRADIEHFKAATQPLPVDAMRALATRLEMVERAIRHQMAAVPAAAASQLQSRKQTDNIGDMHLKPRNEAAAARQRYKSPEIDAITDAGFSVTKVAEKLTEDGYKISHTYLGEVLSRRRGIEKITPELKAAIWKAIKVRI